MDPLSAKELADIKRENARLRKQKQRRLAKERSQESQDSTLASGTSPGTKTALSGEERAAIKREKDRVRKQKQRSRIKQEKINASFSSGVPTPSTQVAAASQSLQVIITRLLLGAANNMITYYNRHFRSHL